MAKSGKKSRSKSSTGAAGASHGAPRASSRSGGVEPASARPANGSVAGGGHVGKILARRAQYMVSPRPTPAGLQPLSTDFVTQQLMSSPDITVVKTIEPPRLLGLQSADGTTLGPLVLARMAEDKAKLLQAQAGTRLTVERDPPLTFGLDPGPGDARQPNPGAFVPHADGFEVTFEVTGDHGPLPDADVFVFGSMWPTQGKTAANGRVTLTITGESPDTIRSLYIKPKVDYWGFWLDRPQLVPNTVNTVGVKPLSGFLHGFPGSQLLGWGQRAMGLDRVPASIDGAGIKVAVIDSGAARTHRNLHAVGPGANVTGGDPESWTDDTIGHGSHCAGIIAGGPIGSGGIRGFAPAAQVHVVRIFPGGRFSDLVSALDYCMENGVDVVNMSLGGGEPSHIIEERLVRAKDMGVACIVAAGNSGGPVQYPASSTHCLAVSAMGKLGEFPEDSFHAEQILDGFQSQDSYFPAKFSCFGPEIDVCAPGVAIVSSVPDDSFGAWDGTSMAAPHVAGLAALVLAHHPDFKGVFQNRDGHRVERLFQILKASATPLQFGDTDRTGAGLPNAPRALGLEAGAGIGPATAPVSDASIEALRRLLGLLAGGASITGSGPTPQSVDIGGPNGPISRGPARTAGDFGPLTHLFSARPEIAPVPAYQEFRKMMRGAGMLP